jgi:hypothetical protein
MNARIWLSFFAVADVELAYNKNPHIDLKAWILDTASISEILVGFFRSYSILAI